MAINNVPQMLSTEFNLYWKLNIPLMLHDTGKEHVHHHKTLYVPQRHNADWPHEQQQRSCLQAVCQTVSELEPLQWPFHTTFTLTQLQVDRTHNFTVPQVGGNHQLYSKRKHDPEDWLSETIKEIQSSTHCAHRCHPYLIYNLLKQKITSVQQRS